MSAFFLPVCSEKFWSCLIEHLRSRWTRTHPGVDKILDRVGGWSNGEIKIHLLGWLAQRNDDKIKEEAVELVGALEEVAHSNTITKLGESTMMDIVELCNFL